MKSQPPGWFADVLLGKPPREARAAAVGLADEQFAPRDVYLQVLAPALEEVGSRWQRGTATVAQEHLATALVLSIMATLAPRLDEPPVVGRSAVLAGTDGELHAVGLRMLGDFLEADGWDIHYLGALTPEGEVERFTADMGPDVVCLSTTLTTHLPAVRSTIAALRRLPIPPLIMVGGRAYGGDAAVALGLGADAFAADVGVASEFLRAHFADA